MRSHFLAASVVSLGVLVSAAGCAAPPTELASDSSSAALGASLDWPTPSDWSAESFPFPLFFAPDLDHRGVEELRFTAGYGEPKDPTYFSYSFAWLLEDSPTFDAKSLDDELTRYFAGLARRFDPTHFDPSVHVASFTASKSDRVFDGTVQTVDPFHDSQPVRLHVHVEIATCGTSPLAVFSLSPRAPGDATWSLLDEQRRTLRCVSEAR